MLAADALEPVSGRSSSALDGSASGARQTWFSPSIPASRGDRVREALAELVLAQLDVEPEQAADDRVERALALAARVGEPSRRRA